ncbi:MAG: hypothetical protein M3Q74_06050 [Pseudomonadota bacterium]|nr:hypothetical protein [Pseudomonadota bacterium]
MANKRNDGGKTKGAGYASAQVRRAFAPFGAFSDGAAGEIATAIGKVDNIGDMAPDDAARAVQKAVHDATGQRVSVDASLQALQVMHAEANAAGDQVGGEGDAPAGAETATSSGKPDDGGATHHAGGGQSTGTATAGGTAGAGATESPAGK